MEVTSIVNDILVEPKLTITLKMIIATAKTNIAIQIIQNGPTH